VRYDCDVPGVNQTFVQTYGRQGRKLAALVVIGCWTVQDEGTQQLGVEIMGEEFHGIVRIGSEGFGAFG
jgi:hypothetical protein